MRVRTALGLMALVGSVGCFVDEDPYAQGGEPKDGGWQQATPTSWQDSSQETSQDSGWSDAGLLRDLVDRGLAKAQARERADRRHQDALALRPFHRVTDL